MATTRPLALVTGSAHRLGRVFAETLALRGYDILLHYFESEELAVQTAASLEACGAVATLHQADLTDPGQIASLFAVIDRLRGPLQALVNSAAMMPAGEVEGLTLDTWERTLALNLTAPFHCAQLAAQRMKKGMIVNISDIGAGKAWTRFTAYTVSKAALESLTRILARSLAPRIRVNAIAPGIVMPGAGLPRQAWERLVARLPLRRPAASAEIASALEFLLDNEYITGHILDVDGGYDLL